MNSEKRDFSIDERLSLCASFVRPGTRLADIGTDHGYLPIRLSLDGKIESAVAADIRVKPLKSAESNIQKYGVTNIKTVLSDGLQMRESVYLYNMDKSKNFRLSCRQHWKGIFAAFAAERS